MAFGSIEIPTIARAQDYTTIKHNEDNKALVDQTVIGQQAEKTATQRANSVTDTEDAQWQEKQHDARDKGSNEYTGDGGSRRRRPGNKEQGRVVVKGRDSFDMKI